MKLTKAIKHIRNGNGDKVARLSRDEQIRLHMEWEQARHREEADGAWLKLAGLLILATSPWWAPLLPGVTEQNAAFMHSLLFAGPMVGVSLLSALMVVLLFWPQRPRTQAEMAADYDRDEAQGFGPKRTAVH